MIYLDNAATTRTAPEVVEAMLPYFTEYYGNAGSIYGLAGESRKALLQARETIAGTLGAEANEIYFTAGGSESDNWALKAVFEAWQDKGRHIITSRIEHHAVLHTCEYLEKMGARVTYLDVDSEGLVDSGQLERAIRPDTILISVMAANNEVGTIQPVKGDRGRSRRRMVFCSTLMRCRRMGICRWRCRSAISTCFRPVRTNLTGRRARGFFM